MKKFLVLVASVAFCACSTSVEEQPSEPEYDPVKTRILYKAMCGICHGEDGKMAIAGAKDLSESLLPLEDRILIITNGKGNMTPFNERLQPEQIRDVALYIETLRK
jgi:mono/diheme cytochrome c family protein